MAFSPLDSNLLGSVFTTQAMEGAFSDETLLASMLQAETALARAQASQGFVPDDLATAIAGVLPHDLDWAELRAGAALSGVLAVPFVKAVTARLPSDLQKYFHLGTTTQDIADTATVLQMRHALNLIATDLRAFVQALVELAERTAEVPCAGRTAGLQAAPVTFGYKVAGWALAAAEHLAQVPLLRSRILVVSLGGPVGTLTSMGEQAVAVQQAYAQELGLGITPIAWHTQRARIVEVGAWLGILIGTLAKMASDVISLSATEVAEVAEPHAEGRGGSSAMPHKRNPIGSMKIMAAHAVAPSHLSVLLGSMASLHERPVGAWHAEWHALPALFGLGAGALREAVLLASGLEVNEATMQRNLALTGGLLFSDAATNALSRSLGRKAAYEAVSNAADLVRAGQGDLLGHLLEAHCALVDDIRPAFDMSVAITSAARIARAATEQARVLINA